MDWFYFRHLLRAAPRCRNKAFERVSWRPRNLLLFCLALLAYGATHAGGNEAGEAEDADGERTGDE